MTEPGVTGAALQSCDAKGRSHECAAPIPFLWVRHGLSPEPITIMLVACWLSKAFLAFTQPTLGHCVCTRLMPFQAHAVCMVTRHGGAVGQPVKVLQRRSPPTPSSSA